MRRGTIFIGLFILIAGGIFGAATFLRSQPPYEIMLAVDPLAQTWVDPLVRDFNATNQTLANSRRIRIVTQEIGDLEIWTAQFPWSASNHPDAWLPSASFAVAYANNAALEIIQPSTARTLLLLAGRAERVNTLSTAFPGDPLDWGVLTESAGQRWTALGGTGNFVSLAFPLADSTTTGFGVLLSGAAAFEESPDLSGLRMSAALQDYLRPVIESVPNFNTIGADAAAFMARGAANGDLGFAAESQWLSTLAGRSGDWRVAYPQYALVFDFPLVAWNDADTPAERREAVALFGSWLMQTEQQVRLPQFGVRPAQQPPAQPGDLFEQSSAAGIQRNPTLIPIVPPPVNEARALVRWFTGVRP